MTIDDILTYLEEERQPENIAGMARFGITPSQTYGIRIPVLRKLARQARTRDRQQNHELAQALWAIDTRETRILASMVDEPRLVSERQMEAWAAVFDYWEIVDQCCMNLFEKMPIAYAKAAEWSERQPEFVKRAGFVLMARLAVSDKKAEDARFLPLLALVEREAGDGRNGVKKAVNWALRQIGKRNLALHAHAVETAVNIQQQDNSSARWIAADALRELHSEAVLARLQRRA